MSSIILKNVFTTPPPELKKSEIKKKTIQLSKEIGDMVYKLQAEKKHSLLVVLQGMDTSGKDGAMKNVFNHCLPTALKAHSFKKPTDIEFAHDFLWRCHKLTPAKGEVTLFIRSHYEDILIQKVHNWIDDERREKRMQAINSFEQLVQFDNNTTVLKFYLHLSKERQLEKLQERLDLKRKHWKHNDGDWEERKHWDKYMECYEYAINNSKIPWIITPVDKRWYRNYFIAKEVHKALTKLNPQFPELVTERVL